MKLSTLFTKQYETISIDIVEPHSYSEDDLKDVDVIYDRKYLKLRGYFPHGGYVWFMFDAIRKGTTGISFLCSRLDISHYVIVTVE